MLITRPLFLARLRAVKGQSPAQVRIEALETDKRPVSAVADFTEVRDVVTVDVRENRDIAMTLLFDREFNLEERVLKEQFAS